jgi:citrate lyase subunit beta / citryl-CoA lyase
VKLPVSYLFVPGDRPDRFAKALAAGAEAIIIDLEDAVAPDSKPAAREHICAWTASLPGADVDVLVRINDVATPWFDDDLALIRDCSIRGIMLPKAERAVDIARLLAALRRDAFVIPIVETARGVLNVDEVASAAGVQRVAFGTLDYAVDLDLSGDERGFVYPACRMALASRAAGIATPIAGVTPEIGNDARLESDLQFARACGFGAKLCIHPRQLAPTHRAFTPTAEEVAWAQRVVAAVGAGRGAVQVDGKMVDRPVVLKAQGILEHAAPPSGSELNDLRSR